MEFCFFQASSTENCSFRAHSKSGKSTCTLFLSISFWILPKIINYSFRSVCIPCNFMPTHSIVSVSNNLLLFLCRELCAVRHDEERCKGNNLRAYQFWVTVNNHMIRLNIKIFVWNFTRNACSNSSFQVANY